MNLYQIMQEYKKVSGVYCITNPNGNIYIGSAVDLKRRMQQYKRLDCKNQRFLYNSLSKYGLEGHGFQIICVCPEDKLLLHEQYYIDSFKPELNICKIAGSTLGYKHTDETKIRMSKSKKGVKKAPFTEEHKRNISMGKKGQSHPHTAESKSKIAESNRKRKLSSESKQKISESLKRFYKEKV